MQKSSQRQKPKKDYPQNHKKVYIAGPDVFAPNADAIGKKYKDLCAQYGFEGLWPLDDQKEGCTASDVFLNCLRKVEQADIVIANLRPFRGFNADDGTVFEIAHAFNHGKRIYGYLDEICPMHERDPLAQSTDGEHFCDANGYAYENFNLPVNCMIGCAVALIQGDLEDCLRAAAEDSRSTSNAEYYLRTGGIQRLKNAANPILELLAGASQPDRTAENEPHFAVPIPGPATP